MKRFPLLFHSRTWPFSTTRLTTWTARHGSSSTAPSSSTRTPGASPSSWCTFSSSWWAWWRTRWSSGSTGAEGIPPMRSSSASSTWACRTWWWLWSFLSSWWRWPWTRSGCGVASSARSPTSSTWSTSTAAPSSWPSWPSNAISHCQDRHRQASFLREAGSGGWSVGASGGSPCFWLC